MTKRDNDAKSLLLSTGNKYNKFINVNETDWFNVARCLGLGRSFQTLVSKVRCSINSVFGFTVNNLTQAYQLSYLGQ